MFTGIIESIGKITSINERFLGIETTLNEIALGESLSVNGVCLTVTGIKANNGTFLYSFDFSPERLGGHMVSGHIEGIAQILEIRESGGSFNFKFAMPGGSARYIIFKGSVAIDGISLTVSEVAENYFSAAVIPHTFRNTNLHTRETGEYVNIETDMIAKYVENIRKYSPQRKEITSDFLKENGF
jgi:riboflavin synthase